VRTTKNEGPRATLLQRTCHIEGTRSPPNIFSSINFVIWVFFRLKQIVDPAQPFPHRGIAEVTLFDQGES
jgi:hypothetical protein